MAELKLAKLPDRVPVKISIIVSPALDKKLRAYAEAYREAYGDEEKVSELVPFMLEQFLDVDLDGRTKKDDQVDGLDAPRRAARKRVQSTSTITTIS
jgi:hypothetical protein